MRPKLRSKQQHGVGLIELLVAVLLLSVGFLAAARMQVQGMRFSQSAYYQSQAYFMASDMLDRMRVNVDGVDEGAYSTLKTEANLANPGCASISSNCSPADMALQDQYDWSRQLHPGEGVIPSLPGNPEGTVQLRAGSDGIYDVTLTWSETINGEDKIETLSVTFVTERK